MDKVWAEKHTIIRGTVGSNLHGLAVGQGEDRDEMGIFIPPPETILGIMPGKDETIYYRTAEDRLKREGTKLEKGQAPRSGEGDLDLTLHSLSKWCHLAAKGNPSVMAILFAPDTRLQVITSFGDRLRLNADYFYSQRGIRQWAGYMHAQKERLLGERGGKDVKRPELVEKFGFDTKYAMHVIRLGYQGVEYASMKKITLPMVGEKNAYCRGIRLGEVPLPNILMEAERLEKQLEDLSEMPSIPPEPAYEKISHLMVELHMGWWQMHKLIGPRVEWTTTVCPNCRFEYGLGKGAKLDGVHAERSATAEELSPVAGDQSSD